MCREDFTAFAETCSKEFGDRVKFWTAINEANVNAGIELSSGPMTAVGYHQDNAHAPLGTRPWNSTSLFIMNCWLMLPSTNLITTSTG